MDTAAYLHGIYPRSEDVVAATRGLERGRVLPEDVAGRYRSDLEDLVRVQQDAGLDYFSDGLLRWQDIFRPLVEAAGGIEARTLVRWFNNNTFFRAPHVLGPVTSPAGLPDVIEKAVGLVPEPRVATLPSPFIFSRAAQGHHDRNGLMRELAAEVLRPVVETLTGRGFRLIHLEEPWLAFFGMDPADWEDFEKAVTQIRDGAGDATLVLHTYFGDAAPIADRLRRLPVDAVGIDLLETDPSALGSDWEVGLVAGCIDGRSSWVESAQSVAEFAAKVAETVRPPSLFLSSNSELEFLSTDIARRKALALGEAATLLRERVR